MGSIVSKLNYLADTKDLILEAINSKGGSLTDEDTFRSYADAIMDLSAGGSGDPEPSTGYEFPEGFWDLEESLDSFSGMGKWAPVIQEFADEITTSNLRNISQAFRRVQFENGVVPFTINIAPTQEEIDGGEMSEPYPFMANQAFEDCGLTAYPTIACDGQISWIEALSGMFTNNPDLPNPPSTLFNWVDWESVRSGDEEMGLPGVDPWAFAGVFEGCSGITEIPSSIISNFYSNRGYAEMCYYNNMANLGSLTDLPVPDSWEGGMWLLGGLPMLTALTFAEPSSDYQGWSGINFQINLMGNQEAREAEAGGDMEHEGVAVFSDSAMNAFLNSLPQVSECSINVEGWDWETSPCAEARAAAEAKGWTFEGLA